MIRKIKSAVVLILLGSMIFGQSDRLEAENEGGAQDSNSNSSVSVYCAEVQTSPSSGGGKTDSPKTPDLPGASPPSTQPSVTPSPSLPTTLNEPTSSDPLRVDSAPAPEIGQPQSQPEKLEAGSGDEAGSGSPGGGNRDGGDKRGGSDEPSGAEPPSKSEPQPAAQPSGSPSGGGGTPGTAGGQKGGPSQKPPKLILSDDPAVKKIQEQILQRYKKAMADIILPEKISDVGELAALEELCRTEMAYALLSIELNENAKGSKSFEVSQFLQYYTLKDLVKIIKEKDPEKAKQLIADHNKRVLSEQQRLVDALREEMLELAKKILKDPTNKRNLQEAIFTQKEWEIAKANLKQGEQRAKEGFILLP